MIVQIGKNKIVCKHAYIVYDQVYMWDAFIPDEPFDFDFDYNFCLHNDGTESVCVSTKAEILSVVEGQYGRYV